MKKVLIIISVLIITVTALSAAFPSLASGSETQYEERDVTAYLYEMEKQTVLRCLFFDGLDGIPYVETVDFLSRAFTDEFTTVKNEDGTYTVSCKNKDADVIIDAANDTVTFRNQEVFLLDQYVENSSLSEYAVHYLSEIEYENEPEPFALDLGEYGFDIVEHNEKTYFPFSLLGCVFFGANALNYVDGSLYFVSASDDLYYDRTTLTNKTKRDPATALFTYNQLCLCVDHFYGRPGLAIISDYLSDLSFDEFLENSGESTKRIKDLLLSENVSDHLLGLGLLEYYFFDGGHCAYNAEIAQIVNNYPESELGKIFLQKIGEPDEDWENMLSIFNFISTFSSKNEVLLWQRNNVYDYYRSLLEENPDALYMEDFGNATLVIANDTAIFSFDSFENSVIDSFKHSLDKAAEAGVKNFAVDLTVNTGGSTGVLTYILTMIKNKEERTDTAYFHSYNTTTGNHIRETVLVDLNLDGKYDDADKDVYYDFDFAILSSNCSFSAANTLSVNAQDAGIAVIGCDSGGGSCTMSRFFTPENYFYFSSTGIKYLNAKGEDNDVGAKADYDLRAPFELIDLSEFGINDPAEVGIYDMLQVYDPGVLGELIHEYYHGDEPDEPDIPDEPEEPDLPDNPETGDSGKTVMFAAALSLAFACASFALISGARKKRI